MVTAAFIISLIALGVGAMTLPTAFQMWWGKPRLELDLKAREIMGVQTLKCHITNGPIKNKFLRWLGVVRQSTDVLGMFQVSEAGSGKILASGVRAKFSSERDEGLRYQATISSVIPIAAPIVVSKNGRTRIYEGDADEHQDDIVLPRGRYKMTITIVHSHDVIERFRAEFVVGLKSEEVQWAGGISKYEKKVALHFD